MTRDTKSLVKDRAESLGRELKSTGRNLWLAGLGVASSAGSESRRLFDELVAKGQQKQTTLPRPWKGARGRVKARGEALEQRIEESMSTALHRFGVPGRDEVTTLISRIEQLTQKVEDLAAAQRRAASPSAS